MKLVGAKAFLGGRQQVYGLEPKTHRNVAIFKDGPDLDGKGLAADIALIGANPGALAVHFANALFAPAMRANRTIGPYSGLNKGIGGFFIVKMRGRND